MSNSRDKPNLPSLAADEKVDHGENEPQSRVREDMSRFATPTISRPSSAAGVYMGAPSFDGRQSPATSFMHIDSMAPDNRINMDTYGVSELRDGYFDALFLRPPPTSREEVEQHARDMLPAAFKEGDPLSAKRFFPRQIHEIKAVATKITTTTSGIQLLKAFLAFFIAYVLCLVPVVRNWLGRYDYFMVISVILNHPSRTIGSQIDGAVMTILGNAAGLAWGIIGLLLSRSTWAAKVGHGGILTTFLAVFVAGIALVRASFVRLYQAILCAGVAVAFTTLAEAGGHIVWSKVRSYAISWLLGQAIALAVNLVVFPDTGNRPLAQELDTAFRTMQEALIIPRPRDTMLRRRLDRVFLDMSIAYRDMRMDLTITRFRPGDVRDLRNLVQGTITALLSMETETVLFEDWDTASPPVEITIGGPGGLFDVDTDSSPNSGSDEDVGRKVAQRLSGPTKDILTGMMESLKRAHAALMDISGCRKGFGPPDDVSSDVTTAVLRLQSALAAFDVAQAALLESSDIAGSYVEKSRTVALLFFARHVRETAGTVVNLANKVHEMQTSSKNIRVNLPTYPPRKVIHWINAQVRHDRSGVTAGMYKATFAAIEGLLDNLNRADNGPHTAGVGTDRASVARSAADASIRGHPASRRDKLGYRIWTFLHRMQGHESRYALKVAILMSVLSIPAWTDDDWRWWDHYEGWWAVCMGWIMMHPRVGGNIQDLVTRAFSVVLGAAWSGAAFAAGRGNPIVMGVFAAIYMIPMLYRFTQSRHPRSGLAGCISFVAVSLSLRDHPGVTSAVLLGLRRGLVFFIGTTSPMVVSWVLWPFVARHELREAMSSMLFFMTTIYRNVVANYVYFDEGEDPTPEDIRRSEMIESRMREGFVRIRQLMVMTRHEVRLRAPFDPLPYSALAGACERFFEHIVALRQSALFYNPNYVRDNPVAAERLLTYRRDAVAAILGNLYILAGALRSQRKVPRYLPSAAAARKKLLLKAAEVARSLAEEEDYAELERQKTWSEIYSYSYNESLTGCVAQLEELERFTKFIVGEKELDGKIKLDQEFDDEDDSTTNKE